MPANVLERIVVETPVAVIDFETTGLAPGPDRVVEVSVVRVDPGAEPRLVVDTLVNPDRPMAATEIHGITDRDVKDAPRFFEVGGDFLRAISGCVVASYNVYFDIGFLNYELLRMGKKDTPPHLCLMYLRPLLDLGKRCSLGAACEFFGISLPLAHQSAADAQASSLLWLRYVECMQSAGMKTFADLAKRKQYKFFASMEALPLDAPSEAALPPLAKPKSRAKVAIKPALAPGSEQPARADLQREPERLEQRRVALHRYWDELTTVLADLEVSRDEVNSITKIRREFGLTEEEVRGMHARAFADLLIQASSDKVIDGEERNRIRSLRDCLKRLGWAPGD